MHHLDGPTDPAYRHHGWIESSQRDLTRADLAETLLDLGGRVQAQAAFDFGSALVTMADAVSLEQVFERNHHGNLVLRLHAEWTPIDGPAHRRPAHHHHHHHPHWIEFDQGETTRVVFGELLTDLGRLLNDSSEIAFGSAIIALTDVVFLEQVFERSPHGDLVLRMHIEWAPFPERGEARRGRSPKFGPVKSSRLED